MMTEEYLNRSQRFRRPKNGPHGQLIELYAVHLIKVGLVRDGKWRCLNSVSGLLSWIAANRSKLTNLDEDIVERYLRHRADTVHPAGRPGGTEAVALGAARCGLDRTGGGAANHPAGQDIPRVR